MYKIILLFISLLSFSKIGLSYTPPIPYSKSIQLNFNSPDKLEVDMGTTHYTGRIFTYLIVRVQKKVGSSVVTNITERVLSDCNVINISQKLDSGFADAIIYFDVYNDGGYNSCNIEIDNGTDTKLLHLGAIVGN